MKCRNLLGLWVLMGVSLMAATAQAASATLDLQVNPAAKTWSAYLSVLAADTDGVASFDVDVVGSSGVSVSGSSLQAAMGNGWTIARSDGLLGIGIRASQDTFGGGGSPVLNQGVGSPILLATGAYAGEVGQLTLRLHSPGFINVFPNGFVGGSTQAATVVNDAPLVYRAGDFDGDTDCDGNDFLAWQSGYPTLSGATVFNGDADGDGDVDGNDFLIWQSNYPAAPLGLGLGDGGDTLGSVTVAVVPEPASMLLLTLGGLAVAGLKRRSR